MCLSTCSDWIQERNLIKIGICSDKDIGIEERDLIKIGICSDKNIGIWSWNWYKRTKQHKYEMNRNSWLNRIKQFSVTCECSVLGYGF